ncbi:MAG: hypothetical protein ACR2K1_09175 [Saprospiraceae bacterium]
MNTIFLPLFALLLLHASLTYSQTDNQAMLGKWEVTAYSEQGIQVDKKAPATPQAIRVWQHIRQERARFWYGYDENWDPKKPRQYERWEERDSTLEVNRLVQAISMPYYAILFPDGTLSLYNKSSENNQIFFPESRRYQLNPTTNSLFIFPAMAFTDFPEWRAQILSLSQDKMTLFLPESGEIVQLIRTNTSIP